MEKIIFVLLIQVFVNVALYAFISEYAAVWTVRQYFKIHGVIPVNVSLLILLTLLALL